MQHEIAHIKHFYGVERYCCNFMFFGLILAMFLTFQLYDFDAIAHAGAPLGV